MKSITTALQDHLAGTLTTLATCWQIIRTDGVTFAFTSLDADLVVDDVTYSSVTGFSQSAIATGSAGGVDNLETIGFFSDDAITLQDLANGLFDYATVYVFLVNWADLSMGIMKLRRGWLGETINSPSGMFVAELRGLTYALVQEYGNFYSPYCRADLGDNLCKVPLQPPQWQPDTNYAAGAYVMALTQSTTELMVAIFQLQSGTVSGATEPAWDTTIGTTTADNNITWLSQPYYRGIGTVVSVAGATAQQMFVSGPLTLPGIASTVTNTAVISVRNNVSAGTAIEISDGINTIGFETDYDIRGSGAAGGLDFTHGLYYTIVGGTDQTGTYPPSDLDMTAVLTGVGPSTILLTNNSGQQGNIIKTGDYLDAIVISNFATAPLTESTIVWITGNNAGTAMEMKTYDAGTSTVTLWLATNYPIEAGDTFYFDAGCDKTRATCQNKFNNILNNRSEPDMPGMDAVLSYPDTM